MTPEEKINILVVDDVPDKLLALEAILEELGQNVITVTSGREALRQVLDRDFAVILLDVNMPGMDGFETAALIRQRQRSEHIPIIFVTAFSDETHAYQGYSLGAVDYILAPVVPEVLRAKVGVFVDLYRKTQQVKLQAEERVTLVREQARRASAEEARRRSEFLADASMALSKSLDVTATLEALMNLVMPALADAVAITLFNPRSDTHRTELAWIEPQSPARRQQSVDIDALHPSLAESISRFARPGGSKGSLPTVEPKGWASLPESVAPLSVDGGAPEFGNWLLIPLLARGRTLGVLTLGCRTFRQREEADDLLLEEVAIRAALAIDNARLYGEVQEGDRRKDEFLAMLGHELRNPLAAISTALDCLTLGDTDEEMRRHAQDVLQRQSKQMTRLVDDLLDVSRITRGKVELRKQVVDLAVAVHRAVSTVEAAILAQDHRLTISLPPAAVKLEADPARLEQVLANLLNNAAKYTPPGGEIWLTASCEDKSVLVRVRDTGIGISANLLPKLFDPFTQGNRSLDRSQGGLGIGLTLVRSLVELHGGEVHAFSKGDGAGSEFTVRLPRLLDAIPRANDGDDRDGETGVTGPARKWLLVDDNADLVYTMAALLKKAGHEVLTALDGQAAIECAAEYQPDIILVDIGLPGMNGYEVVRKLREQPALANVLMVAMSGYGQDEDRRRSEEAGFDRHLTKPVRAEVLEELLTGAGRAVCAATAPPNG